eukprot:c5046_g2_i1 orf=140-535(-)
MSFLFGFDDPKYSDRKLRLIISPDTGSEDNQEDGEEMRKLYKRRRLNFGHCEASTIVSVDEVEEYHLNTLLLAKESLFFRRLFDGECFKESAEKVIDIHLTPAVCWCCADFLHLWWCIYQQIFLLRVSEMK